MIKKSEKNRRTLNDNYEWKYDKYKKTESTKNSFNS